jgi:hypothetical protein
MEKLVDDPDEERAARGLLELREVGDRAHYYLDGKQLDNGDPIELLLGDGTWLRGTYEWRGIPVVWPAMRLELAGRVSRSSERRNSTAMPLPPTALLRRPKSAATSDEEIKVRKR